MEKKINVKGICWKKVMVRKKINGLKRKWMENGNVLETKVMN